MATILVLDGEADSCELLRRVLERKGHRVFAFTSPDDATKWAQSKIPDLAVVALVARDGNSSKALAMLKRTHRDLPVIVIADCCLDRLFAETEIADFLLRPVEIDLVESRVSDLLDRMARNNGSDCRATG